MKILRDYFFHSLDLFIPRSIAAYPYQTALESLTFAVENEGAEIWARNSYRKGNFTFGVSDLDLTVFFKNDVDKAQLKRILQILKDHKTRFPFLGEANFYWAPYLNDFAKSLNLYERLRDPVLHDRLPEISYDVTIEKTVFLLRMLLADAYKLKKFPVLRQKKWKQHFADLNLPSASPIRFIDVVEQLKILTSADELGKSLEFLANSDFSDSYFFFNEKPKDWKFIYPNKYLWFRDSPDLELESLSSPMKDICVRQIGWEIWGIMSQLPNLASSKEGIVTHMGRLEKVSEMLAGERDLLSQFRVFDNFKSRF